MDKKKRVGYYVHFGKRQELVGQISRNHFVSYGLATSSFFVAG